MITSQIIVDARWRAGLPSPLKRLDQLFAVRPRDGCRGNRNARIALNWRHCRHLKRRFRLLLFEMLAYPLAQAANGSLRSAHLLADFLRRKTLQTELHDGPFVSLQTSQQIFDR